MKAYVLIETGLGMAKNALIEIRKIKGVTEADGVYGYYDIIAKIEGENLGDLVVDEIQEIEGVEATTTLVAADL